MELQKKIFLRSPGGEHEGSSTPANENNEVDKTWVEKPAEQKPKGFFSKIKEALRDWSNQDQADQQFDDTRV